MDKTILDKLLAKINREELIKLIALMTQSCDKAEQVLLDYCQKNASSENHNFIIEKQIRKHWNNAYIIIDDANTYGSCSESDEGDVCYEIDLLIELIEENETSWEVRKEILDKVLEQIAYNNCGFTDMLVDTAMVFCHTNSEREYLAGSLSKGESGYYKGLAASIYREIGEDEKFLETKKANLEYGSDYLELADYYKKNGQPELALKIVLEGLDKCDGRLDGIYQYLFQLYRGQGDETSLWNLYKKALKKKWNIDYITELMYHYFKEKNDYTNQKKMLINLVRYSNRREVNKWYQKCKEELNTADWQEHELELLENVKSNNLSAYLNICIEKGNTLEVLEYVKKQSGNLSWNHIDEDHRYSKILVKNYPDEILNLYWKEVNVYVGMCKKKNYIYAVTVLKEIQSIMSKNKRIDEWNEQFGKFKDEHKRKKLLMHAIED